MFSPRHISQSKTKRGDPETHVLSDRTINQFQVGFNPVFNFILPMVTPVANPRSWAFRE
jgi:hypothetical protein